jgi:hypothetical protein
MMVWGRCVAAVVAALMMVPAAASAAAPQKNSGKLPSSACKLLTLAQVQKVLPGAMDGEPVHDKADKQEICSWRVDQSTDYLGVTVRAITASPSVAKALYGTTDRDRKVKGLGGAAAFAPNDSDYTVRAALGKVALVVKLQRSGYDVGNPDDVAELKSDATSVAKEAAKKL